MTANFNKLGQDVEHELGWEDEIEKDSSFVLLPAGEYEFTVKEFERARFAGSEKMPACNQAKLKLEIVAKEGTALINHNLFLHSRTEGMVSAFFVGIGQKKHGEKLKMNWQKVIGAKGRAKVGVKRYNDKDYNEIKQFIEPEQTAAPSFSAGKF